ncbi:hypothetical protein ARMSODRAFT_1024004 [Armillaria solidipes]|uniref:Uncharacterized protein n=1 Tax=Armillaria solidipes TaxID=1076256 RepID=A0A2H3AXW1_9AGAR|nr:hypothetical protein ARMSODRAFT_1024004 [Armillaria solidipes]
MFVYLEVQRSTGRTAGRIHFFTNRPIRYRENTPEAAKAASILARAEEDRTMALINSFPERGEVSTLLMAPSAPSNQAPLGHPPRPLTSIGSTRPSSTRQGNTAPPASPNTVEAFLAEVTKEIEKQISAELDFWPDEGNSNSVLPVPGPLKRSMQLINEAETGLADRRKSQRSVPYPTPDRLPNAQSIKIEANSSSSSNKEVAESSSETLTSTSVDLTLSPLALEYPSTAAMEIPEPSHRAINGRVPGYTLRPDEVSQNLERYPVPARFRWEAKSWAFYAAPNLLSLTHPGKDDYEIHPLILEHAYLVASDVSAALMKAWVNASSVSINSPTELILHCLEHNDYPVNARIAADVPFLPGFLESHLNDNQGPALLNASYRLRASEVSARMNAGAAVAKGGSLGWLVRKLTGIEAIKKFLNGPSYVAAHLFNVELLPANENEVLMSENLTLGEEMALVGFVPGCARKGPRSLFPTSYILRRFLQGYVAEWTDDAEVLMKTRWDLVNRGEAEAMTEEEWGNYIGEFHAKRSITGYIYTENDAEYGVDLFKSTYPTSWSTIHLRDMTFPERYEGSSGLFEGH